MVLRRGYARRHVPGAIPLSPYAYAATPSPSTGIPHAAISLGVCCYAIPQYRGVAHSAISLRDWRRHPRP
eukprot:3451804-Rhodomonas_salina.2